ncbi:peptidoglycan-binding protein [Streptomyces sp. NPDC006285]|uniref:peptidoglycan-binding domain-containing protein n=1 Tax=Streptomyces sp. NPDC006285 TaxID=3364742 RepID=UPI0036C44E00
MSDRSGHICPECGAPWESGGSPTCDCARRAADELLQTRSAEAAAAEDFDPLRIRPYVDLGVRTEGSAGPEPTPGAGDASGEAKTTAAAAGPSPTDGATLSIPVQRAPSDPVSPPTGPPLSPSTGSPEHQGRVDGGAFDAARPHPAGGARPFDDRPPPRDPGFADFPGDSESPDGPAGNTSRRRRFVLVGAGATAAVLAAAGFAGGLFSYESPSRNGAAPDDLRASVPDASGGEPSPSASASTSASASESATESAAASASPSVSDTPSASATPSRTTATTSAPPVENSADTTQPPSGPPEKAEPVVLGRGDEGPEVVELQLRLKQLALYVGEADGDYDARTENAVRNYQFTRGIEEDRGTYTLQTRQRLESETTEP